MGNPRKRKAIKDGRMQQMVDQKAKNKPQPIVDKKEKLLFDEPIVEEATQTNVPMDSFIADELEEIKRISPTKKKTKTATKKVATKKTTTKKTTKKKTGNK